MNILNKINLQKRSYHKQLLFVILLFLINTSFAQITRVEYIAKYKKLAILEMKRTGIPASITMAQALLESNNGNSKLAKRAKNHFGIKCHSSWEGKTYHKDDDKKDECFRKYSTVKESYLDHSEFLKKKRYAALFELKKTDYKGWARGLKKAGYATNSRYSSLLISIIQENKLYELDTLKSKKRLKEEKVKVIKDKNKEIKTREKAGTKTSEKTIDNFAIDNKSHSIILNNRVKYVIVKKGDTFKSINTEFDLISWQLPKYNELERDAILKEGQILYLQPKRNKAAVGKMIHIVKESETLYSISQLYAIKLKKLLKYNFLSKKSQINVGDKLYLRNPK